MGSVFLRGDTGSWVIQYKDLSGMLKTETGFIQPQQIYSNSSFISHSMGGGEV